MYRMCCAALLTAVFTVAIAAAVAAAPMTFTHQGRLLDAVGEPIDGNVAMIFRVYDDAVGGSLIWSESHPSVSVTAGLYSVSLGSSTPLDADLFSPPSSSGVPAGGRFLEIEVAGETISPRTQILSSPYAIAAERVSGDIESSPGKLAIGDLDHDGIPDLVLVSESSSARLSINTKGTGAKRTGVTAEAVPGESSEIRADGDFNEDGSPDIVVGSFVTPDSSGFVILGYDDPTGTGVRGQRALKSVVDGVLADFNAGVRHRMTYDVDDDGIPEATAERVVMADSIIDFLDLDDDDDGTPELGMNIEVRPIRVEMKLYDDSDALQRSSVTQGVSTDSVNQRLSTDLDGDGVPDQEISSAVVPTKAQHAINTKGTGAQNGRVVSIQSETTVDSALQAVFVDDDGDGNAEAKKIEGVRHNFQLGSLAVEDFLLIDIDDDGTPEQEVSASVVPTKAQHAINTKGTGAQNGRVVAIQSETTVDTAMQSMVFDDDGDGIGNAGAMTFISAIGGGSGAASASYAAGRWYADSDDDGLPEGDIEAVATPGTCAVAIKVRGTGADKNRSAGSSCDDSSSVDYLDIDDDGDGISEAKFLNTVTSFPPAGGATSASYAATALWSADSDDDGVPEGDIEAFATPGTCRVAIKTKGTGAANNLVVGATDDSTATMELATDSGSISLQTRKGGVIKGSINVNHGSALRVGLGSDGNGYFATGVGVGIDPTHPFEAAGGAYCDGTSWVNASDANVKENFQAVDGDELLDKIADLEITKWNYKGDTETEHIGPTAQDFQAVFGVGSDGKSISTIDPSGIALAAIKALNEKSKRVEELEAKVAELSKQLEQLAEKLK